MATQAFLALRGDNKVEMRLEREGARGEGGLLHKEGGWEINSKCCLQSIFEPQGSLCVWQKKHTDATFTAERLSVHSRSAAACWLQRNGSATSTHYIYEGQTDFQGWLRKCHQFNLLFTPEWKIIRCNRALVGTWVNLFHKTSRGKMRIYWLTFN